MDKLFKELRRRNLFRVAGVYAVVGWLLAQVAATLEGAVGLPAWFDGMVVSLLLIGFPVAIILAWAFEMTPEGVKLTAAVPEGESVAPKTAKTLDYVIIGGLALVGVMIVADRLMPSFETRPTGAPQDEDALVGQVSTASIAVLPFADLSPEGDQEYFSDGIAEEILNVLVRIDRLKVASRTSAFGFKGQQALGIPVIAEKLNVRHVLEGSVRKAGDTIRITAQLIDAQSDAHLWSATYDRTLTAENLFAIQDEIAKAIVAELGLHIEGADDSTPTVSVKVDTQNLDAYETFLEARALFTIRNNQNLSQIIDLYEQVVEADPDFARGWAGLSAAYGVAPSWELSDRDYYRLAKQSAHRTIDLNPELGLPYAVLAEIDRTKTPADFVAAFANFDEALKRDPNEVNALQWRGETWIAVGFFDRAIADYTRCIDIDPAFLQCRMWLAKAKFFQGKSEEAFTLYEDAVAKGGTGAGAFHFSMEYAHAGDERATALSLSAAFHQFSYFDGRSDSFIRALTDPAFDFEAEANAIEIEWKAKNGSEFIWDGVIALIFKKYQFIKAGYYSLWWIRTDPEFLTSPERKRLIRNAGIYDYWRAVGFPPQCKPVGKDDFECE